MMVRWYIASRPRLLLTHDFEFRIPPKYDCGGEYHCECDCHYDFMYDVDASASMRAHTRTSASARTVSTRPAPMQLRRVSWGVLWLPGGHLRGLLTRRGLT